MHGEREPLFRANQGLIRDELRRSAAVGRDLDGRCLLLGSVSPQYRAILGLCAFAGLRLGEAAGTRVSDVDFLRRQLTVARQVQRANAGAIEIRSPKYGSERVVFLADGLVEMRAQHVAAYRPGDDPNRWLFKTLPGNPPHQDSIGHAWRQACKPASLQACKHADVDGFTLHDLRHYFASGLIASGCDVVTVQRALGHAKATTTLITYAHLWPTAEDRTRAAAEQMMDAIALPREAVSTGDRIAASSR